MIEVDVPKKEGRVNTIQVELPLTQEKVLALRAGDSVRLHGEMYIARDAAHKRLMALIEAGEELPVELSGACIYYAGPCPAAPGELIGPCGPTTSGRMDAYTPALIDRGLCAMVGKGARSAAVVAAMRGRAVYFAATGGAAVLIAQSIVSVETVAFDDLGPEALRRIVVRDFPAIVAVDACGGDLYAR
ncbi:FumA C-terminus/TtdB family hydratase beta subunit [Christensenellaceae bacterium OttesenSCG-928-L17]|nr:FumA C-terminus/TtdB family hydratase beta subunit [Christensenellaceae bacterium OttesenSCG-928-L17]